MKRVLMMCVAMVALASSEAMVRADGLFPQTESQLPEMPIFWPIWFPFDDPPAPVPPIPDPVDILEARIARLESIQQEIDELEEELALLKFLLALDPNGINAPMLQMQIDLLNMEKQVLEDERRQLRDEIEG